MTKLEKTMEIWNNVETVDDFLNFIENPDIDYMNWSASFADSNKSGYWIGARIKNIPDVAHLLDNTPQIKATELSPTSMTESELEHHKNYNFGSGYDRHVATQELMRIADVLGFEDPSAYLNNQPTGTLMGRHVDSITCFLHERTEELKGQKFDRERRQPQGSKDIWRCFVALDDWRPGQIVNFEPNFWTHWKKGDVLFFDWRNTAHSTANAGMHNRPFLKITGTMKDDQFVLDARQDQDKVKVFNLK
jgi:hypothetical protein|tara:strand:+ start:2930 stop:3673 length:744 start_codon:yes stop_codon:yes gene_type:complete